MASRSLILQGVAAGYGFLPRAWSKAWGAMLAAAVVLGGVCLAGGLAAPGAGRVWPVLAALAALIVADGALYRLALNSGSPGAAARRWGGAELRLSAVFGLSLVFLGVLGLLAFVVILVFAFAVASSGSGFDLSHPMTWGRSVDWRGKAVVEAVFGLCMAGLAWAGLRLSLAPAATVASGRVQVLASWPKTRRLVVSIIAGRLLLGVAPLLIIVACVRTATSGTAAAWPMEGAAALALGLALAGGWLPLNAGFMAFLYRSGPAE